MLKQLTSSTSLERMPVHTQHPSRPHGQPLATTNVTSARAQPGKQAFLVMSSNDSPFPALGGAPSPHNIDVAMSPQVDASLPAPVPTTASPAQQHQLPSSLRSPRIKRAAGNAPSSQPGTPAMKRKKTSQGLGGAASPTGNKRFRPQNTSRAEFSAPLLNQFPGTTGGRHSIDSGADLVETGTPRGPRGDLDGRTDAMMMLPSPKLNAAGPSFLPPVRRYSITGSSGMGSADFNAITSVAAESVVISSLNNVGSSAVDAFSDSNHNGDGPRGSPAISAAAPARTQARGKPVRPVFGERTVGAGGGAGDAAAGCSPTSPFTRVSFDDSTNVFQLFQPAGSSDNPRRFVMEGDLVDALPNGAAFSPAPAPNTRGGGGRTLSVGSGMVAETDRVDDGGSMVSTSEGLQDRYGGAGDDSITQWSQRSSQLAHGPGTSVSLKLVRMHVSRSKRGSVNGDVSSSRASRDWRSSPSQRGLDGESILRSPTLGGSRPALVCPGQMMFAVSPTAGHLPGRNGGFTPRGVSQSGNGPAPDEDLVRQPLRGFFRAKILGGVVAETEEEEDEQRRLFFERIIKARAADGSEPEPAPREPGILQPTTLGVPGGRRRGRRPSASRRVQIAVVDDQGVRGDIAPSVDRTVKFQEEVIVVEGPEYDSDDEEMPADPPVLYSTLLNDSAALGEASPAREDSQNSTSHSALRSPPPPARLPVEGAASPEASAGTVTPPAEEAALVAKRGGTPPVDPSGAAPRAASPSPLLQQQPKQRVTPPQPQRKEGPAAPPRDSQVHGVSVDKQPQPRPLPQLRAFISQPGASPVRPAIPHVPQVAPRQHLGTPPPAPTRQSRPQPHLQPAAQSAPQLASYSPSSPAHPASSSESLPPCASASPFPSPVARGVGETVAAKPAVALPGPPPAHCLALAQPFGLATGAIAAEDADKAAAGVGTPTAPPPRPDSSNCSLPSLRTVPTPAPAEAGVKLISAPGSATEEVLPRARPSSGNPGPKRSRPAPRKRKARDTRSESRPELGRAGLPGVMAPKKKDSK